MSVDTAFVKQYEKEVHHVFQREGGILRNAVRLKTGVVGTSTTFQKIGKGSATTKGRHAVITPMNPDHTSVECNLVDRYAGDWVDKLDETRTQHNEREAIAKAGAWAIGRAVDNDLFLKMDGTGQTAVGFSSLSSQAAARNALISVIKALNANEVPNDGGRYVCLTANAWAIAETVQQFSSADYVDAHGRPFVDGAPFPRWRYFMGAMWTNHQGLPGAGTASAKGFAWHKNAVGYAIGQDLKADITWHGDRAAHFVNHMFSGGAALIDDLGVIEITINDTDSLPTS
jgi:hypothetical protein